MDRLTSARAKVSIQLLQRRLPVISPDLTEGQCEVYSTGVKGGVKVTPLAVQGLEMVLCRAQGFERVSDEELLELRARSDTLDTDIAKAFKPVFRNARAGSEYIPRWTSLATHNLYFSRPGPPDARR